MSFLARSSIFPGTSVQNIFIGNFVNTVGVLNQNGGSITVSQNLKMGSDTPSTGTNYGFYNMSGGSFTVVGVNRWRIGQAQGGTNFGISILPQQQRVGKRQRIDC